MRIIVLLLLGLLGLVDLLLDGLLLVGLLVVLIVLVGIALLLLVGLLIVLHEVRAAFLGRVAGLKVFFVLDGVR